MVGIINRMLDPVAAERQMRKRGSTRRSFFCSRRPGARASS
jgi:hypothetical protein